MKYLSFCLRVLCIMLPSTVFAQSPQQIEVDLLKSFEKIDYWREKQNDTTIDIDVGIRSLLNANNTFAKKLKYYAENYPATIIYPFSSLKKDYLIISTSSDHLFRIYSWDTETGGTMHFFENVMQYKSANKMKTIIDTPRSEGDVRPGYYKISLVSTKK